MNNNMMMDIDPLSYEQFEGFPAPSSFYPQTNMQPNIETNLQSNITTNIQPNIPTNSQTNSQCYNQIYTTYQSHPEPTVEDKPSITEPETEQKDIKPDITTKKKARGKTSNYWNKKIVDKDFAFYGCSICNIAYTDLQELDKHVTIHANRITSYDLRLQSLKKRKRLKKMKKKEKKDKIKQETDVEIKPEGGYIGTEKTSEFIKDEKDVKDNSLENNENHLENNENHPENNENHPENNKNVDNQNSVNVYKCFGCNKQFALSYYLKIHVRSHTDEKPYLCSECGQSFITASKRGRHMKRIHQSVRHQCRICYKFFSRFDLLVKHFDKKHAEDKIEGEPYDYNTILPYLKELEEQLKLEKEKKPKIEDLWDQSLPAENTALPDGQTILPVGNDNLPVGNGDLPVGNDDLPVDNTDQDLVPLKYEQDCEEEVVNGVFVDAKSEVESVTTTHIEEVNLDFDIKEEADDINDINDNQELVHDDHDGNCDDLKEEKASSSEDEYFPSQTWVRPPSPPSPRPAPAPRGAEGGRGPVTCDVCKKMISSKSYLTIHMRTHTGEKPYTCYICNRGFITASKMHRHVLTHAESWEGTDGIQPEDDDIKSETGSNDDDKEMVKNKRKSKLEKAKAKLLKKSKESLKKKKHKKRQHVCEFCHQRFLHSETLQVHRKCHKGQKLVLQCQFCLEVMSDEASLKEHETSHSGAKPYLCTICGNGYKKRETMIYHRKSHKQTDDKTYVCDMCSKKFKSQTTLERHIVSHSVPKFSLQYECPVCAHMFHTRYHVRMHLNTHMKEGLIQEENRSAVLAMVLQNARKIPKSSDATPAPENIPTDERSRICNICGQIFQHFYYLEEHLKTHGTKIAIEDIDKEEEKKYTCQVCSKSFKLHYYLKLHSYTHTKEKPFICQQCGKGFITKGKLKRHLETHQGLKKYQCHICYKFFTRPSYLRIHVRTIHGTQDYNFTDYGLGVPIGTIRGS